MTCPPATAEARSRATGRALVTWFRQHARDLPWRKDRNPYRTWVSEVMLQQTTAEVVRGRFPAFLARFPDLPTLAAASPDEVRAAWAGLGYYRRARSLHAGAQAVMERFRGVIPADLPSLRSLPGVGSYTAGALRALAFGLPAAPLDGNVTRVLARLTGERRDPRRAIVRRAAEERVLGLIGDEDPAAVAESLIELGALVCRPTAPRCGDCPVAEECRARAENAWDAIPRRPAVKPATPVVSVRALLLRAQGQEVALWRRSADAALLPGFLELPGLWCAPTDDPRAALAVGLARGGWKVAPECIGEPLARARHAITHHRITAQLRPVRATRTPGAAPWIWRRLDSGLRAELTTECGKLLHDAGMLPR